MALFEKFGQQVDYLDTARDQQLVEGLVVDIESRWRSFPAGVGWTERDVLRDSFGVDRDLGRDRYHQQADSCSFQLAMEIGDRFEWIGIPLVAGPRDRTGPVAPERSDGQCTKFGHEEHPSVGARNGRPFLLLGTYGQQSDDVVEVGDLGVGGSGGLAGMCQVDQRAGDRHHQDDCQVGTGHLRSPQKVGRSTSRNSGSSSSIRTNRP